MKREKEVEKYLFIGFIIVLLSVILVDTRFTGMQTVRTSELEINALNKDVNSLNLKLTRKVSELKQLVAKKDSYKVKLESIQNKIKEDEKELPSLWIKHYELIEKRLQIISSKGLFVAMKEITLISREILSLDKKIESKRKIVNKGKKDLIKTTSSVEKTKRDIEKVKGEIKSIENSIPLKNKRISELQNELLVEGAQRIQASNRDIEPEEITDTDQVQQIQTTTIISSEEQVQTIQTNEQTLVTESIQQSPVDQTPQIQTIDSQPFTETISPTEQVQTIQANEQIPVTPTCSITANPPTITIGETSTLTMTVSGTATSVVLDGTTIANTGGTKIVVPTSTATYLGSATGTSGTNNCLITISVNSAQVIQQAINTRLVKQTPSYTEVTILADATGYNPFYRISEIIFPLDKALITNINPAPFSLVNYFGSAQIRWHNIIPTDGKVKVSYRIPNRKQMYQLDMSIQPAQSTFLYTIPPQLSYYLLDNPITEDYIVSHFYPPQPPPPKQDIVIPLQGCFDEDNGKDYFTKGRIFNNGNKASEDVCTDTNEVREWFCNAGIEQTERHACSQCVQGACLKNDEIRIRLGCNIHLGMAALSGLCWSDHGSCEAMSGGSCGFITKGKINDIITIYNSCGDQTVIKVFGVNDVRRISGPAESNCPCSEETCIMRSGEPLIPTNSIEAIEDTIVNPQQSESTSSSIVQQTPIEIITESEDITETTSSIQQAQTPAEPIEEEDLIISEKALVSTVSNTKYGSIVLDMDSGVHVFLLEAPNLKEFGLPRKGYDISFDSCIKRMRDPSDRDIKVDWGGPHGPNTWSSEDACKHTFKGKRYPAYYLGTTGSVKPNPNKLLSQLKPGSYKLFYTLTGYQTDVSKSVVINLNKGEIKTIRDFRPSESDTSIKFDMPSGVDVFILKAPNLKEFGLPRSGYGKSLKECLANLFDKSLEEPIKIRSLFIKKLGYACKHTFNNRRLPSYYLGKTPFVNPIEGGGIAAKPGSYKIFYSNRNNPDPGRYFSGKEEDYKTGSAEFNLVKGETKTITAFR